MSVNGASGFWVFNESGEPNGHWFSTKHDADVEAAKRVNAQPTVGVIIIPAERWQPFKHAE